MHILHLGYLQLKGLKLIYLWDALWLILALLACLFVNAPIGVKFVLLVEYREVLVYLWYLLQRHVRVCRIIISALCGIWSIVKQSHVRHKIVLNLELNHRLFITFIGSLLEVSEWIVLMGTISSSAIDLNHLPVDILNLIAIIKVLVEFFNASLVLVNLILKIHVDDMLAPVGQQVIFYNS